MADVDGAPVSYDQILDLADEAGLTQVVEVLRQRANLRTVRLAQMYTRVPFLQATEDLLRALEGHVEFLGRSEMLGAAVVLARRARADVEQMLNAWLSGDHAPYANAARDLMEIEWLIRDFAAEPGNLAKWASCSRNEREKKFAPKHLRRRIANREHPGRDLPDSLEYQAHSESLHVTPDWPPPELEQMFRMDAGNAVFWLNELFSHGSRVLLALDALAANDSDEESQPMPWNRLGFLPEASDIVARELNDRRSEYGLPERGPVTQGMRLEGIAQQIRKEVREQTGDHRGET